MARVFIINDAGHNYFDAERYGDIVVMTSGLIDKFAVTAMLRIFKGYLSTSAPSDFLLISGPTVMNAIACAEFAALHNRLNILTWKFEKDGNDRYIHHRLVLDNKEIKGVPDDSRE